MTAEPYPAEHIRWRRVQNSLNVDAIGWDRHKNMYVEFHSGGLYMYVGVSRQRAVQASRMASVGKYIHWKIKPAFPAVRIELS